MYNIQHFNTKYIHTKIQAENKLKRNLYEEQIYDQTTEARYCNQYSV